MLSENMETHPSLRVLGDTDLLLLIALSVRDVAAVSHLVSACRATRVAGDETFYTTLAHRWWGREFWAYALRRPTLRRFRSMRDELQRIHTFESSLRAYGVPPWTHEEYYRFWEFEARACRYAG